MGLNEQKTISRYFPLKEAQAFLIVVLILQIHFKMCEQKPKISKLQKG